VATAASVAIPKSDGELITMPVVPSSDGALTGYVSWSFKTRSEQFRVYDIAVVALNTGIYSREN
jgi:hypothetical protein